MTPEEHSALADPGGDPPSWIAPVSPVVPDHDLIRRIGGGSYGDVWLARTAIGTWRAVKIVFRDRFTDTRPYEREFRGIQKFEPLSRSNEAFVDILQIGRNDAGGYFYYVMELADDAEADSSQPSALNFQSSTYTPKTLSKVLLQRGRLPINECLELGLPLNLGLAQLHRAGLIHRDIKPSNIIFVGGVPKLADIGLVIETAEAQSFVGTEGYIPPEGPTSPQADLYSLGKVLYEAGMGKDRKDFPEPLSNLAQAPDALQILEFNAILLRACAANRADRYQSAEEMNADLALLRSGHSVRQHHRVAGQLKLIRRAGLMAALLAILVGLGWWWQAHQTRQVRELASDRERRIEADRERLIHLNIANGVQEMEKGYLGTAMLWLGEALALSTNRPDDSIAQRIRIQQLVARHPRLLQVFAHPAGVTAATWDGTGQQVLSACSDGTVRLWNRDSDDRPLWQSSLPFPAEKVRFLQNGRHLLLTLRDPSSTNCGLIRLDRSSGVPSWILPADCTAVALSPDERWIATAGKRGRIQILSTDTGALSVQTDTLSTGVQTLVFTPDSTQVLAGCDDGTARRWVVGSGKPTGRVLSHIAPVIQAVISPDGNRLATTTGTKTPDRDIGHHVWNAETGALLSRLVREREPNSILAFHPSSRLLLAGDLGGGVRVWNADSVSPAMHPIQLESAIQSVAFSPDGAYIAIGVDSGMVQVRDAESGLNALPPLFHAGRVTTVGFNQDGSQLLTASDDGAVKIWDLTVLPEDSRLTIPSFAKARVGASSGGRHLLLGVQNYPYEILRLDTATFGLEPIPFSERTRDAALFLIFDRAGRQWAATAGVPEQLGPVRPPSTPPSFANLWRQDGDRIQSLLLPHPTSPRGIFFHEDGSRVVTVSDDHHVRIWRTADGTLLHEATWPVEDLAWIAFSPDLRTAVAVYQDERGRHLLLRDVETQKPLGPPAGSLPAPTLVAFSPDGRRLAVAADNHACRIWDTRTGEPLTPWFKQATALRCIEWSPDGRLLLTAGKSGAIKFWDSQRGVPVSRPLTMNTRQVEGARFSADGRFVTAWGEEKQAQVWEVETGHVLTPPVLHDDHITEAFVTDSGRWVSVSHQCVLRAWDLQPASGSIRDLRDYGILLAGRTLDHGDVFQSLTSRQLADLLQSLRKRRPDWFIVPSGRLDLWHERQVGAPSTLSRVDSALFHLNWLLERRPGDESLRRQQSQILALRIPPRDPATPAHLLDLTRAYTESLDMAEHGDFAELPRGRQTLHGIEYDLRGMVRLDHRAERPGHPGPFHPAALVDVGQSCRAIHFLQAAEGEPRIPGIIVARWIIQYSDGTSQEWPVVYGQQILDWWWWVKEEPLQPAQAKVAWRGRATFWNVPGTDGVRLFESTWTNPRPDVPISRLEFHVGESPLKPFVIAVTAD